METSPSFEARFAPLTYPTVKALARICAGGDPATVVPTATTILATSQSACHQSDSVRVRRHATGIAAIPEAWVANRSVRRDARRYWLDER
jgi:hypothetical protein